MAKTQKPEKYLIRHTSGSKNNQVEEFSFKENHTLTIGRSPSSNILFDPEEDTIVSREHGTIVRESESPYVFKIKDNSSRNGIYVNKQKVNGEALIKSGDEIQLGLNGPTFEFNIYPLPEDMMPSTRLIDVSKPTQEMRVSQTDETKEEPAKASVGKQTVERLLKEERGKSNKTLVASIVGALIVLSAIGFVFRDSLFKGDVIQQDVVVNNTIDSKAIVDVEDIAAKYRKSVVMVSFSWRLYLTSTNEALWHEFKAVKDPNTGETHYLPLFVRLSDGSIEPKLTTDNNVPVMPIGVGGASGSGFIITKDGFILTNSHVASNWNTSYSFNPSLFPGILVNADGTTSSDPITYNEVSAWIPAETKQFGYNPTNKSVTGKNTYLNVTFADNDTPIPVVGEPIPSSEHDVALIKINTPRELPFMEIDENSELKIGAPTVVMGYPSITPPTYSVVTSKNVFNQQNQIRVVAKPTTTTGTISNILEGIRQQGNERVTTSTFGDAFQLQINETGNGNSGGPVINKEGKVIGIFFAGNQGAGASTTYGIPIKYGVKLLNVYN